MDRKPTCGSFFGNEKAPKHRLGAITINMAISILVLESYFRQTINWSEFVHNILKLAIVTILAAAFWSSSIVNAESGYAKQKVVYHINYDNPKQHTGALRNIQNHINAVGEENLDLKVVLHGNGLAMLLEPDALSRVPKFKSASANDEIAAKIAGLKDQGVGFHVCANTINGRKVDYQADLHDVSEEDIVSSGVAEVAKLQAMGYSYIKP